MFDLPGEPSILGDECLSLETPTGAGSSSAVGTPRRCRPHEEGRETPPRSPPTGSGSSRPAFPIRFVGVPRARWDNGETGNHGQRSSSAPRSLGAFAARYSLELLESDASFPEDGRTRLEQDVFAGGAAVQGEVDQRAQCVDVEAEVLELGLDMVHTTECASGHRFKRFDRDELVAAALAS